MTGEEVWRVDGPPAYASPMAFDHGGVRQIVTMSDVSFFGVGATDGDPLWSLDFTTAFQQNTPTTVRYDGNFILSGYQWGTAAIKVEPPAKAKGDWSVSEVWKTTDAELYMDSAVTRRRPPVLPFEQESRHLRLSRSQPPERSSGRGPAGGPPTRR